MPEVRASRRFGWSLFGVAVAGFVVRLVAVATIGRVDPTAGDGYYYHQQANFLAKGHWFVDPYVWRTSGRLIPGNAHPPLWTVWLALSSAVGGSSYRAHKTMACLAGALLVVALGLLVRELAGRRAGLIAAVLAAIYPPFWIIDGLLMPEELYAATVAFVLLLAYRWRRSPTLAWAAALGAMLAVSSLTRAEVIALAPLLVLPLILLRRTIPVRERLKQLVVCGATCALLLSPWVVRNARDFHRFEPVSTNGDELFVYANNPVAYGTDTRPIVCTNPSGIVQHPLGRRIDPSNGSFLGYWSFNWEEYLRCMHGEPPGDVSDKALYWRHQGIEYARQHPGRLPVVMAARVGRTWEVYRPFQNASLARLEGRTQWVSDLGLWAYWALLLASVGGLVALRRRRVAVWPVVTLAVLVTITSMYAYGDERFRLPLDVAVVALAAVALDALWRRLRPRSPEEVAPQEPDFVPVAGVAPLHRRATDRVRRVEVSTAAVVGVVVLAVLIPLRGLLLHPGAPMEEGFMLVFPERVLHGAIPNRDFLHLYGPGSLWFLSAGYWLFGTSVATERLLGLLQLSGIVAAVVLLARPFGRWLAAVSGLACLAVIVPPLGLVAMAWDGAVALAALSVVIALSTRRAPADGAWQADAALDPVEEAGTPDAWARRVRTRLFVAGLVAAGALLFRPDLVVAVSLGLGGALWTVRRRAWRPLLAGAAVGLVPYLVHLATAGPRQRGARHVRRARVPAAPGSLAARPALARPHRRVPAAGLCPAPPALALPPPRVRARGLRLVLAGAARHGRPARRGLAAAPPEPRAVPRPGPGRGRAAVGGHAPAGVPAGRLGALRVGQLHLRAAAARGGGRARRPAGTGGDGALGAPCSPPRWPSWCSPGRCRCSRCGPTSTTGSRPSVAPGSAGRSATATAPSATDPSPSPRPATSSWPTWPRSRARASACSWGPSICARRPTARRSGTSCSPTSSRPPTSSSSTRGWPTGPAPAWRATWPRPTG